MISKICMCVLLLSVFVLAGCAYNPKVAVYGASGKQYIAPDLCGAIVQCKQASEAECLYNSTLVATIDGKSTETYTCKSAK